MRGTYVSIFLAAWILLGSGACATKKDDSEHFGVKENFPVFEGPGDFFRSYARVAEIVYKHELDGKPVDMSWIEPKFREQLCLTVTINNHCGGG